MVMIDVTYLGELRTEAVHAPSGSKLITDAPIDNHGKGEAFSPTDLVATALGSCMLTIMGIVAARHDWDITGATASIEKTMAAAPSRRIERLTVRLTIPGAGLDDAARHALEKAAHACPVHATLGENVDMPVDIAWT
ncbi:MAG: osmotically inducible protein OsmC [Phycisphaerae bacterium]|nr:osmotically inducible protein OsmC [Phycisphaerae bacterium]